MMALTLIALCPNCGIVDNWRLNHEELPYDYYWFFIVCLCSNYVAFNCDWSDLIMKVDQLIKILQQYPSDTVVRVLGIEPQFDNDSNDDVVYMPVSGFMPWKDPKTGIEYLDL